MDDQFEPLHNHNDLKDNPHAYVKLWKHHGAQDEATLMKEVSEQHDPSWIQYYGHNVNSEWMIPKILEVKTCARNTRTCKLYYGSRRLPC